MVIALQELDRKIEQTKLRLERMRKAREEIEQFFGDENEENEQEKSSLVRSVKSRSSEESESKEERKTVAQYAKEILEKAGGPLHFTDIAEKIKKAGYVGRGSSGKSFNTSVYMSLRKKNDMFRPGQYRGTFELVK